MTVVLSNSRELGKRCNFFIFTVLQTFFYAPSSMNFSESDTFMLFLNNFNICILIVYKCPVLVAKLSHTFLWYFVSRAIRSPSGNFANSCVSPISVAAFQMFESRLRDVMRWRKWRLTSFILL